MTATYGDNSDFPGVTVTTTATPKEHIAIHIDNADREFLPMKLALDAGFEIVIYGPNERSAEMNKKVKELREEHIHVQGVVG